MKYFALLYVITFLNCSGQSNKKIVGKWTSNRRDFVSSENKNKILKSQTLPYFETFEFLINGKGVDWTIDGHPEHFDYHISNDTLFFGRFTVIIDTLTDTKLVYTRLDNILSKPDVRQYFIKSK